MMFSLRKLLKNGNGRFMPLVVAGNSPRFRAKRKSSTRTDVGKFEVRKVVKWRTHYRRLYSRA